MPEAHHRVAIVGAGPAGALLAWLLASRGIETLLLERQQDFERAFRGELLMPSGLRALAEAEVDLSTVATRQPERVEAVLNGRPLASFTAREIGDPPPRAVSQPELLERLVAMAVGTGRCHFLRGTTVRNITRRSEGGTTIEARDEHGARSFRADFLIGADGRGAASRRCLDPKVAIRSAPLDVVWFKLPYPSAWPEPRARFQVGRGHLLIAVQSVDDQMQAAWVLLKGSYGELKSRSIAEWVDEMAAHTDPELADHLRRHRDATSRPFLLNAIADRVRGWAEPGTLLIGDAAHTMSPVGAQGLNIALRDAIVAANELIPALQNGGDVDTAAARVERLRGPEIDVIQRIAALPPRIVMGRTVFHELARRTIARVAGSPLARGRAARVAGLFTDGVTEVSLRV